MDNAPPLTDHQNEVQKQYTIDQRNNTDLKELDSIEINLMPETETKEPLAVEIDLRSPEKAEDELDLAEPVSALTVEVNNPIAEPENVFTTTKTANAHGVVTPKRVEEMTANVMSPMPKHGKRVPKSHRKQRKISKGGLDP